MMLLSAGSNAQGQLANNSEDDVHFFTPCIFDPPIDRPTTVLQFAAGANHSLVVLRRQESTMTELWGSGDSRAGQLGYIGTSSIFTFITLSLPIAKSYSPRLIASAWETSYVVLSAIGQSDVLISMGSDDSGALGAARELNGNKDGPHIIDFIGLSTPAGISLQNCIITVLAIDASPKHVVLSIDALQPDGENAFLCIGWGASRHGQLGQEAKSRTFYALPLIIPEGSGRHISNISLGHHHTILLDEQGHVMGFGSNKKGQLECLGLQESAYDVGCTWDGTYIVLKDSLIGSGSHGKGQLGRSFEPDQTELGLGHVEFPQYNRPVKLACGSEHILALLENGDKTEVWGWGWNEHGNLALGSTHDIHFPTRIWPREDDHRKVVNVFAGSGTSWLVIG